MDDEINEVIGSYEKVAAAAKAEDTTGWAESLFRWRRKAVADIGIDEVRALLTEAIAIPGPALVDDGLLIKDAWAFKDAYKERTGHRPSLSSVIALYLKYKRLHEQAAFEEVPPAPPPSFPPTQF